MTFALHKRIITATYALTLSILLTVPTFAGTGPTDALNGRPTAFELAPSHALLIDSPTESLLIRIELLRKAKKEIFLSTFIFEDDTDGAILLRLLEEAARRGVKVRLLLDALGKRVDRAQLGILYSAGDVGIYEYNPLKLSDPLKAVERMHDKLVIVDNKYLLVGGRNVENPYFGTRWKDHKKRKADYKTPYTDRDVVVTGPVVERARKYFVNLWKNPLVKPANLGVFAPKILNQKEDLSYEACIDLEGKDLPHCLANRYKDQAREILDDCKENPSTTLQHCQNLSREFSTGLIKSAKNVIENMNYISLYAADCEQFIEHWNEEARPADKIYFLHKFTSNNEISKADTDDLNINAALMSAIRDANERVYLTTPYLIPTDEMYDAIDTALTKPDPVKDFRILTNSLWTTDHALTYAGYEKQRAKIAKRDLKLFEYSFNQTYHAKAAIFDSNLSFVGSYNFDPRSQNLNTETGVLILGEAFNAKLAESLLLNFNSSFAVEKNGEPDPMAVNWPPDPTNENPKHPNATIPRRLSYFISKGLLFVFPFLNNQL